MIGVFNNNILFVCYVSAVLVDGNFRRQVEDKDTLQDDLTKLVKWSEKWQMLFNFSKCKCIHLGHGNVNREYFMGDTMLGTSVKEKGLGVTVSADMTVSEQCGLTAAVSQAILRC